MLNLNFPLLDQSITIENMTILTLENPEVFSNIVQQIYNYDEANEIKLYNRKYDSLKQSELLVVIDILGYSLNSATILKLIYSDLDKQISDNPELKSTIEKLILEISELLKIETYSHDLSLNVSEPNLLGLIKMFDIKIDTDYQNIFEKCIELIQVFKYLPKKKLLILVNACSFFTLDEVNTLSEEISLHNIDVLFIENREVYQVKQYVIDYDFFLIEKL